MVLEGETEAEILFFSLKVFPLSCLGNRKLAYPILVWKRRLPDLIRSKCLPP